jgi:hypothetical protein
MVDQYKHQGNLGFRDYFENLYSNKLKNLEEMDKFLDQAKMNQEDINT